MNQDNWRNITLSLAGIVQSAKLVNDIARTGELDEQAFATCINSVLKTQSDSITDIYEGVQGLRIGLQEIPRILNKKTTKKDVDMIRYIVSLIYLEKKFSQSPDLKKTLSRRIQQAQSQATHFAVTDKHVVSTLASAFLQTLGQLRYRVQIVGNVNHLKQEEIVAKIRTLLLAGVRAAVLWRQMGGNKWQMFFSRRKIIQSVRTLLNTLEV